MSIEPTNANAELAAQIVAALRNANYLAPAGEEAVLNILTSKTAKAGEWRALLEQELTTSTSLDADDATPNQGA